MGNHSLLNYHLVRKIRFCQLHLNKAEDERSRGPLDLQCTLKSFRRKNGCLCMCVWTEDVMECLYKCSCNSHHFQITSKLKSLEKWCCRCCLKMLSPTLLLAEGWPAWENSKGPAPLLLSEAVPTSLKASKHPSGPRWGQQGKARECPGRAPHSQHQELQTMISASVTIIEYLRN